MKMGRSLEDLAKEITRQQETKRDFIANTEHIQMRVGNEPRLIVGDELDFGVRPLAHGQVAAHAGIPKNYYDRMLNEAPALLAENVNTWFHKNPAKRMVRTLDGDARAFLSDAYRPLDNFDLLEAALPRLFELNVDIMSCEVTESRLYLKVVDKRIQKDIPTGRALGDGSHIFFDTACPALVLSNSEVGAGALSVQTAVFTRLCTNLAIVGERSARKYHIGARADIGEALYALLSDKTRKLTDAALWAQIGDVVTGAFDQAQFDAVCEHIGAAAKDKIEADPVKVVEITAKKFGFNETERAGVLTNLIKSGDLSRYGLHAAITRTAEDLPDYDRASSFEAIGGKVIDLTQNEWHELARAA